MLRQCQLLINANLFGSSDTLLLPTLQMCIGVLLAFKHMLRFIHCPQSSQFLRLCEYFFLSVYVNSVGKMCSFVMSQPTPLYQLPACDSVYPPSEDTFLLLDALENDTAIIQQLHPSIVVEIGSGSGVVSVFLSKLALFPCLFLSTDVNQAAAECSRKTAILNHCQNRLEQIVCDLASPLVSHLVGQIDLLLFNPPYVPTPIDELSDRSGDDIHRSWAGGVDGREVLDRFLPQIPFLLAPFGRFYLVAVDRNDVGDLLVAFGDQLSGKILMSRRCGIEKLFILVYQKMGR